LILEEKNYIGQETQESKRTSLANIQKSHSNLIQVLNDWDKIATEANKLKLNKLKTILDQWTENNQKVVALSNQGENSAAMRLSITVGRKLRLESEEVIGSIIEFNQKMMDNYTLKASETYSNSKLMMILMGTIATMIGCAIAYVILRAMTHAINQVIANLDENSNQVNSSAQQIASSSEQLSQATAEQASSLEETASSVQEISSSIRMNAESAKESTKVSSTSYTSATKGKQVIQDMIQAIGSIDTGNQNFIQQVNDSNQKISEIINVISEIGNKTKVINDIVFQTKLLSFNASVEAARAGEHGKGFAVVAEEVGNLAQMSGNAAKEISVMLEGSIQKVDTIVSETRGKLEKMAVDGRERIASGTRVAQECSLVLDEIVKSVSNTTQIIGNIAAACQEQAQGIQEITTAVNQLDQVTQQNAAASEETASAAEELSSQSDSLRNTVRLLVTTIQGGSSQSAYHPTEHPRLSSNSQAPRLEGNKKILPLKAMSSPQRIVTVGSKDERPNENDPRFIEVS
jgi:methyl-accepting chemotaxis protein